MPRSRPARRDARGGRPGASIDWGTGQRGSSVARFTTALQEASEELRSCWRDHDVGLRHSAVKRFLHPVVGALDLRCQVMLDPDRLQSLLVFTAVPGTESAERLALLTVLGTQRIGAETGDPEGSRADHPSSG